MRISASSYSNTAPLIWSFLYGSQKGTVEVILDNAPSRSAALLAEKRVDAALVPVIAYQMIDDLCVVPEVCVGAREKVQSVCLVTRGMELRDVKSVALDVSSKTSVAMTKILFLEFLDREPVWKNSEPDISKMLDSSDCALLIGDPALSVSRVEGLRKFDLVELWRAQTGFGFVFAMWMTANKSLSIDFAGARDEGLSHLEEIVANYADDISLSEKEMLDYLANSISFQIDDSMQNGLNLYFQLAEKHGLIDRNREIVITES